MKQKLTLFLTLSAAIFLSAFQQATAQWKLTGNSDATSSSKLGTTNAVPLRLFTKDVERIRIDTLGRVGIGISTPVNVLTVKSTSGTPATNWLDGLTAPVFVGFANNASSEFVLATASNTPVRRSVIQGRKSRGTLTLPTAVAADDYLTSFLASGYDGTNFQNPATIDFFVDSTPTPGNVPARISFVTGSNQSTRKERLKVGSTGNFTFNDGQLYLNQANGRLGVGTINPLAKLDVFNRDSTVDGFSVLNSYQGFRDLLGVSSTSVTQPGWGLGTVSIGGYYGTYSLAVGGDSPDPAFGLFGEVDGIGGDRYGVVGAAYNFADSSSGNFLGVYGEAFGGDFNAAGYFNGDVYASEYFLTSDRKFKKEITSLQSDALQKIMKLKPSAYQFKTGEFGRMQFPKGNQFGLIADEVKEVFPELVKDAVFPAKYNRDRTLVSKEVQYEGVNYLGLIPILIASTQQQQKQIEAQQAEIAELKQMMQQLLPERSIKTGLNSVSLEQNNPNPLDNFTKIRYSLPAGSKNAYLVVVDISGKKIKEVQLGSATTGNINFDASSLATGTYTYSIIVDGQLAQSKKMIVNKAAH